MGGVYVGATKIANLAAATAPVIADRRWTTVAATRDFTIAAASVGVVFNVTAAATATLPAAADAADGFWCVIDNASDGVALIAPTDGATIDGAANHALAPGAAAIVQTDGLRWRVLTLKSAPATPVTPVDLRAIDTDLTPAADGVHALGAADRRFSALHATTIVGAPPHFHVREEQPPTTSGGSFILGAWRTRRLNTIVSNTITGASLSANTITLPAGRYSFDARAPAYQVKIHQIRLWNLTDDEVLLSGIQNYTNANSNVQNLSCLNQRAEISGIKTIQFQHRCGYSKTSSGFGVRSAFHTGIFAEVIIEKIGEVA